MSDLTLKDAKIFASFDLEILRMKKQILFVSLMILIGISGVNAPDAAAQEFPPGLHWKQIETEHFIIIFDEQNQEIGQRTAAIIEPIHRNVTEFLQAAPASKTYIILADHIDATNGYASPAPNNKIVIYLREAGSGTATFGLYSQDWLSLVLTHEYTHIVQTTMAKKWYGALRKVFGAVMLPNISMPMWMIEGTAVYAETKFQNGRGHHPYYDMMMRAEILNDSLKPLDQMASLQLRKWPVHTIYYLYGYFFLNYLAENYGEETVAQLSHKNSEKFPLIGKSIFKKVYNGKDDSDLWETWREWLKDHYQQQVTQIQSAPVTETRALNTAGYYTNTPVFSPDGQYVYYVERGAHDFPALIQHRLSDGKMTCLQDGIGISGNFTLSADGEVLYFSRADNYHTFSLFSDLYVLNVTTKNTQRLTRGLRAFDPAISPDGKTLVFVTTHAGSMNLMRMELASREITPILETSDHTQFAHPVFSSDGTRIALQSWKEGGFQDIYVMNSDGSNLTALTFDASTDSSPVWGLNDEYLFFSSDRTGVPNIFAYHFSDQKLYQVTNVLTGVFSPSVAPNGDQMVVEYYSGNGMEIHLADLHPDAWKDTAYTMAQLPATPYEVAANAAPIQMRGYNPLPSLLPKLWLPAFGIDEDGAMLGAMTLGQDVLSHHNYSLSALYGLKSQRVSFAGTYVNTQFYPTITLFGSDMAAVFSDIFREADGDDEDYWQREQIAGLEASIPLYRSNRTEFALTLGYRYEKMSSVTDDSETFTPLPDEGNLSGFSAGFVFERLKSSTYGISPESGFLTAITYRRDDKELGSDYNLDTVIGDTRIYLNVPKLRHHVLTIRATGGMSDGDTLKQGMFQMGGYTFNSGDIAGLRSQRFFLRGYKTNALAGNRFALGSVEYRFPIWYVQRGISTVFFDSIVGAAFYDIGNAWNGDASLSDFKQSAGGELRLNLGIQHGAIPLTIRLGYAKGFDDDLGKSQFMYGFSMNFGL